MGVIQQVINDICQQFILGEKGAANHGMVHLTQLLVEDEQLVMTAEQERILENIITAQGAKNYLYVADLLQYELLPTLSKKK